jgi:ribosome-associated toxin RatA of RatAB toxin-antitoxin module
MSTPRFILLAFLFLGTFLFASEAKPEPEIMPHAGQMLVGTKAPGEDKWPLQVKVTLFIEAEQKVVWNVLTDYAHMPEFVPHMKSCAILGRQGEEIVVEELLKSFLVTMHLELAIKESPPGRIDFRLLRGNMRAYDGHWDLIPVGPTATILNLEIKVEPGFYAPRSIVSWVLKDHLPEGLLAVRKRALKEIGHPAPSENIEVINLKDF